MYENYCIYLHLANLDGFLWVNIPYMDPIKMEAKHSCVKFAVPQQTDDWTFDGVTQTSRKRWQRIGRKAKTTHPERIGRFQSTHHMAMRFFTDTLW